MANNKDNNISDLSGVSRQDKPRYSDTQYTPISSADDMSNDDSTCCSLDAPLDFSVKRRREDEELGPPRTERLEGAHGRVKSEPEVVVKSEASSTPPRSRANGLSPATNGVKSLSTDRYPAKIGEPPLALPGALPGGLMPGGGVGMFPIFPTALLNGLPAAQDISVDTKGENGRSSKSAKDYGKESLRLASPTGLPLYNVDLAAAQAMAMNSEEMFSQYRTYIMALQDQMKLQTSPGGSSSTSSASQGPSPADLYSDGHHEPTLSRRQSPSTSESGGAPIPGPTVAGLPSSSRALYGRPTTTHSRRRGRTLPEDQKDELYWERRRKNNEAAKRSRDARRAKEDEIAIRAAFLEQENLKLRVEVAALKNETAKLRCMLYNS